MLKVGILNLVRSSLRCSSIEEGVRSLIVLTFNFKLRQINYEVSKNYTLVHKPSNLLHTISTLFFGSLNSMFTVLLSLMVQSD